MALKEKLIKENNYYVLRKEDQMNVDARLFLNEELLDIVEEDAINQIKNVASMPGIVGEAIAMSDMHIGYGFPIGGVAAFDKDNGCISPGGIGFDINCGVRLLSTNIKKIDFDIKKINDLLFQKIPTGVGGESEIKLSDDDLNAVLTEGCNWALRNGYGEEDDLLYCESNGKLDGAKPSNVSQKAKSRGRKQLGTLGSGNHFIEIQEVSEIFNEDAKLLGLEKGNIVIMIHSGSRGLGHQVCSDYLRKIEDNYKELVSQLPEKDLAYAPINSKIGQEYFSAMKAAANYAWCNRHIMAHKIREVINSIYPNAKIKMVYDVAHNIAKLEKHIINNEEKELLVHRKGATRSFPKGHKELPEKYKNIGQPVLLPGSMGTSSFILVGTEKAMNLSFGSSAHGAGRVMSRSQAKRNFNANEIKNQLEKKNIVIKAASLNGITEEAPNVYKDVDLVVKSIVDAGIAKKIAKMIPLGVIKG
jgi:tRNA-splicing ligase RtcB (3'-phosphate/5'-hydroxy nucleic acid ligase)